MVSIHIDIKTRILPAAHRVYVVRPGAHYRLYDEVKAQNAILYDLPGLELPEGVAFRQVEDIAAQIQRGQALKWWHRVGRHAGDDQPSMDLANYPYPVSPSERRSLSQLLSIGSAYFEKARVGDLVVVPPLRFADPVLVGEIAEQEPVETTVPAYGDLPVLGRRVRWLAEMPKKDVPARIIEISQKPNSFVLLERSTATWFYDRTYRSYVLNGEYQCELRVGAENFGSTDDMRLSAFLNFVVANMAALETHNVPQSIGAAVFANLGEYEPGKRISINSPGEIIVHALKLSPLLFVALLGLSGCAPAEVNAAIADGTVTFGNSAALPGDPCAAAVFKSTVDWLTFVGADLWAEACPIASSALNSAEVELPAVVNVVP
ncbi:hypothetical protein [Aminobacter niigataensis]|uniref:hypothetical protein n=1 Tax=Aminobacter niigataensis TaxID=83265 RepID=UPI0024CAF722|nr:hypothetical protein [Aminobacter niigataensis]CAI2931901.1 conserved protein of unknown function [Aminobacter niigataensis]